MINGLIPDPTPKRLNFQQIREWNQYMQSNPRGQLQDIYAQYRKINPKTTISLEALQNDQASLNSMARDKAARVNSITGQDTNVGNRYPDMEISGKNYGPVNGNMQTEVPFKAPATQMPSNYTQQVPGYINDLKYDEQRNLPYYEDNNGDIVYTHPDNLYLKRFRKGDGLAKTLNPNP